MRARIAIAKDETAAQSNCLILVLVAVCVLWLVVCACIMPASAHAKSHACTSDTINATVNEDGSLHVVDARTYEFDGRYTLTAAVLDPPPGGTAIVNGVSVIDENGVTTQLVEVPFQGSWRTAGGPPSGYYSIDVVERTVYAFSTTEDERKTFVFDYTYTGAVNRYDDVSVLYWQFVAPNWDVDTEDVHAFVRLPVPTGQSVMGGENVYAFAHGNINGSVSFEDTGVIEFDVPRVKEGDFAEMRVAFPASWTPSVSAEQTHAYDGLPQVLEEEQTWEREAQTRRIIDVLLLVIPLCISLACLIVALVLFFRYGREHKPGFTDEYWRDVPEKGTNPAVIARLWRWNKPDANDLTAVLMHLSNLGVVSISRETSIEERKILGDKEHVTYRLGLNPEKRLHVNHDAIDTKALDLVFDKIGVQYGSVTLEDIEAYAKDHAQSYVNSMQLWQGTISAEVDRRGFFERAGERCKRAFQIASIGLIVLGAFVSITIENFMPLIGLLPGAVILLVFSFFMTRRSQEAVDIYARCMALKRWFKDFTALDEAVPTDAKVWGELLVYAYLFGVADQVVNDLNRVAPDIWTSDVFVGSMLWYYNPYVSMRAGAASVDFFGNAFENTMSSAQSIIAAAKGGGGGSFGGGGGFSMGGGGGFGGGGGGFSR